MPLSVIDATLPTPLVSKLSRCDAITRVTTADHHTLTCDRPISNKPLHSQLERVLELLHVLKESDTAQVPARFVRVEVRLQPVTPAY